MKVYLLIEEHECYSEETIDFKVVDIYATRKEAEAEADACRAALAECVGSDTKDWDRGSYYGEDDYYSWEIEEKEVKKKVYIAGYDFQFEEDGTEILGVFSTKELARQAIEKDIEKFKKDCPELVDDFKGPWYVETNKFDGEYRSWWLVEEEVKDEVKEKK